MKFDLPELDLAWADRWIPRYVAEARNVRPANVDPLPTYLELKAAPSARRMAVLERLMAWETGEWECDLDPEDGALGNKLIRASGVAFGDPATPYPVGYAIRLFQGRRLIGRTFFDEVLLQLLQRDGTTPELTIAIRELGIIPGRGIEIEDKIFELGILSPPIPGEAWADLMLRDLSGMQELTRDGWKRTVAELTSGVPLPIDPSHDWRARARSLISADDVPMIDRWLRAVAAPPSAAKSSIAPNGLAWPEQMNSVLLHALVAAYVELPAKNAEVLVHIVRTSFTRVPGLGAWQPRLGYRALHAFAGCNGGAGHLRQLGAELPYPRARAFAERSLAPSPDASVQ